MGEKGAYAACKKELEEAGKRYVSQRGEVGNSVKEEGGHCEQTEEGDESVDMEKE